MPEHIRVEPERETAVNPYISILGPIESAAQRIAVMGICNKIAGMLAPLQLATGMRRCKPSG